MALKFVSDRKPKPVSDTAKEEIQALVDEIGSLLNDFEKREIAIRALSEQQIPVSDKLVLLKQKLSLHGDPDEKLQIDGETHRVTAGKRSTSREVTDLLGVFKIVGEDAFLKICKIALKDLDQYLTGAQVEAVTEKTRGARSSVKITKKP